MYYCLSHLVYFAVNSGAKIIGCEFRNLIYHLEITVRVLSLGVQRNLAKARSYP